MQYAVCSMLGILFSSHWTMWNILLVVMKQICCIRLTDCRCKWMHNVRLCVFCVTYHFCALAKNTCSNKKDRCVCKRVCICVCLHLLHLHSIMHSLCVYLYFSLASVLQTFVLAGLRPSFNCVCVCMCWCVFVCWRVSVCGCMWIAGIWKPSCPGDGAGGNSSVVELRPR